MHFAEAPSQLEANAVLAADGVRPNSSAM